MSAYVDGLPIVTVGDSLIDIKNNIYEAIDLYLESCKELNIKPDGMLQGDYELILNTDKL